MGDYEALAVLAGKVLGDDDLTDDESIDLDWSSLTENVSLQPDPLPPFRLGTHVKKGEWTSQDSSPSPACDRKKYGINSTNNTNSNVDPISPGSDGGELIPPSPVISSTKRKGRRKHSLGRVSKRTTCHLSYSPLVSQEDRTGQVSFLDSLEQLPNTDSPLSKIAASLGCDGRSSVWVNSMETPTTVKHEYRGLEVLSTVERAALLPSSKIVISPEAEDIVQKILNIDELDEDIFPASPIVSSKATTSTPIRMVPRQGRSRDLVKTLFCKEQMEGFSQVVTIRREDLHEVNSDSEDEVKDQLASISGVQLLTGKDNTLSAGKQEGLVGTEAVHKVVKVKNISVENISTSYIKHKYAVEEKKVIHHIPLDSTEGEVDSRILSPSNFTGGFSTASGRKIEVSMKALTEARNKLHSCKEPVSNFVKVAPPETRFTGGFTSAGGNKIKVSEKALTKARIKLNISLMTAGGDKSLSQDAAPAGLEKCDIVNNESEPPTRNFTGGFMTAGGSKIEVSEEALVEARNKFSITKKEKESSNGNFNGGFKTAGGAKIEISESALAVARNKLNGPRKEVEAPVLNFSGGFNTAGGKKISVSDKAIALAKEKMNSCVNVIQNNVAASKEEFVGFKSASGVKIEVSDKALEFARNTMKIQIRENYPNQSIASNPPNTWLEPGFSTATGGEIKSSKKAQETEKAKINYSEALEVPPNQFVAGFSTGKGTKIEVSEKALEAARIHMTSTTSGIASDTFTGGFSTAKGTKIEVSDKAINVAKNRFESTFMKENIPNFTVQKSFGKPPNGFSRGGETIKITANALNDSKYKTEVKEPSNPLINISGPQRRHVISRQMGKKSSVQIADKGESFPQKWSGVGKKVQADTGDYQFEDDWGDDEGLANIAETSERDYLAKQEQPFTCNPFQVVMGESPPYSGGPDMLDKVDEGVVVGFSTPFTGNKRREEDWDIGSLVGKRQRIGFELEDTVVSVKEGREKSRYKQRELMKSKMKKNIRVMPGRLWKLRSAGERISMKEVNMIWTEVKRPGMTAKSAVEWRFVGSEFFSAEAAEFNTSGLALGDGLVVVLSEVGDIGIEELSIAFLCSPGVDPKLVPEGWFRNHYGWIVWGLDSLERRLGRLVLTPTAVMDRIKYRYDREVDRGERSILRKVLEKDESAAVPMVLCVSEVSSARLVLSDGWYSLPAPIQMGTPLHRIVEKGIVTMGVKLIIQGADLVGSQEDQACHPLQSEGRELMINLNSTRRVRFATKLGISRPIMVSLSSLVVGGGITALLKVVVARVYPLLYCLKENGRSSFISEKQWDKVQREKGMDKSMEQLYSQVEMEVLEEERKNLVGKRRTRVIEKELIKIECGEELLEILSGCDDPALLGLLSREQVRAVEEARMAKREELMRKIADEVALRVGDNPAQSTPVLKVRVVDSQDCSGLLTIWRPGQLWLEMKEGRLAGLTGVQVNRVAGHTVHLTMCRSSQCEEITSGRVESLSTRRILSSVQAVCKPGFRPLYNELDMVAVVLDVGQARVGSFQIVTMTAESLHTVKLLVWDGVAVTGAHDILQPGLVVSCKNLEWRNSSPGWPVPSLYLSEHSVLCLNPRDDEHSLAVAKLHKAMQVNLNLLAQAREKLAQQMNRRQPRQRVGASHNSSTPIKSTTIPLKPSIPPTLTNSAWTPATIIPSTWTSVTPLSSSQTSATNSRLAKLEAYTTNLTRQGCKIPSVVPDLPPPSSKVMTPYKPPKCSQAVKEEDMSDSSSQEMEVYAMEMMDHMNV